MSQPLLSVCLITYNQARYIEEAIDTILMQEVDFAWQLIVADDFSTDGTREILKRYQKKHPKLIKLILQKKNVGAEANWLDLMSAPTSKYVLYADGDDYFSNTTKLQQQVDFLEAHKDFSICFHPVSVVYEGADRPNDIFPSPEQRFHKTVFELQDVLTNNFMQTNSVLYRWRFTDKNIRDFIPTGISPGDWFLHILHAEVGKVGFIDKTMSVYRRHAGGLWWDADHDRDKFLERYGRPWLKFHTELLKMYGSDQRHRQIIESAVINLLNELVAVDEHKQSNLFGAVLVTSPLALQVYVQNLRQQVTDIHNHADEQAKIIKHYVDLSHQLEGDVARLTDENHHLKSKKLVRLEGAVKRRVKRSRG